MAAPSLAQQRQARRSKNAGLLLAPGAHVAIRDAEWVVRRVDHASDGGLRLVCDGISELVREREAVFLTKIDRNVEVLDPAATCLVPDASPRFRDSLLFMESQLRQAAPSDERIRVGDRAAMDPVPYQQEPARQALRQPRQRILIADSVGLGKTLEAGILVSELIARGRGRRILVLAVKSMLGQFQKEFWNRFTIPLTRLDSVGIARVRENIPTNHNPFYYYDKSIISIDTLKQDREYRTYLEQAYWDIIVIDEAQNVADRGSASLRSRLAKLLSTRSDTLIMLSATPHDGRARSFASLMNMLDATAIVDPDAYGPEDFKDKGLVIRRFKKDIRDQVPSAFRDRQVVRRRFPASGAEESAYEALLNVRPTTRSAGSRKPHPGHRDLFLVTLEKALFSSPAACSASVEERLRHRRRELDDGEPSPERRAAIEQESASLEALRSALACIGPGDYRKYQELLAEVSEGQSKKPSTDRIVIFTERIDTLNWLENRLRRDLGLKPQQVAKLHGTMSDVDQQRVVEDFGNAESKVRLLLCSDVASEGINLHHRCHRLVHFDLPWSLMVFAQRNGRVDRYGQERAPRIVYLVTESANQAIRGDMRILEVLESKDDQAYKNIGDPKAFMNVHDVAAEEKVTLDAVAAGEDAKDFDERLQPRRSEGDDLLEMFLGHSDAQGGDAPGAATAEGDSASAPARQSAASLSLFKSDIAYCEAALLHLRASEPSLRFDTSENGTVLTVDAPDGLKKRFSYFPSEAAPPNWRFVLTSDRHRMHEAIRDSRRGEEGAWPTVHYLWPLSPVVAWLNDRMLSAFGRHQAPVLAGVPGLSLGETVFVLSGLVPNRKGHPLVNEWVGVVFDEESIERLEPFEELLQRTELAVTPAPNRGIETRIEFLERLLPLAVEHARARFVQSRKAFEDEVNAKLNRSVAALEELRRRQVARVERLHSQVDSASPTKALARSRAEQRRAQIDIVFGEYLEWIQDTMTTEPTPWIKVVCVMTGEEPAGAGQ